MVFSGDLLKETYSKFKPDYTCWFDKSTWKYLDKYQVLCLQVQVSTKYFWISKCQVQVSTKYSRFCIKYQVSSTSTLLDPNPGVISYWNRSAVWFSQVPLQCTQHRNHKCKQTELRLHERCCSMAQSTTAVPPRHWRYCSLALSYQNSGPPNELWVSTKCFVENWPCVNGTHQYFVWHCE